MTAIEEAREQARKALASYEADNWDLSVSVTAESMSIALAALLNATEPPANVPDLPKSDIPATQMSLSGVQPAEDEREAREFYAQHYGSSSGWTVDQLELTVFVPVDPGALVGDSLALVREVLDDAGFDMRAVPFVQKGPRPITDEVVHAAAVAIDSAAWKPGIFYGKSSGARDDSLILARAALEAAEEARR